MNQTWDCRSDMLITRPCCFSVGDEEFIFMILCFLDKFEASKGLNCCCSETWSYRQISNSTSSKKAGKECFPLCFLSGRDSFGRNCLFPTLVIFIGLPDFVHTLFVGHRCNFTLLRTVHVFQDTFNNN